MTPNHTKQYPQLSMAQKDDSAPGGLLSRVVRFVKSPGATWGEGGSETETDRESSYSKQMLKEMIERKRRNDFVRKREFDMRGGMPEAFKDFSF